MRAHRCVVVLLTLACFSLPSSPVGGAENGGRSAQRPACWLRTPTVSVMTGFIYEPLVPYPIEKWVENLGSQFDADRWVADFKAAGASHLVFYDKWIDGLVFHDTKTTGFKTRRDFVGPLAAACQRGGLPLVFYFNAISDGNPEFDKWATLDKQGRPIVFSPGWPTRYQTLHSPFREKALEQVRELLSNYGPIHGIWHDIFHERLNTSSQYVAKAYEQMFGEPFESATRLEEFNARTLAGYLDQVDRIRRSQGQDQCIFTANGSGGNFLSSGIWTDLVGSRLGYLFNEGHSFARNDQLARMAWVLPKPLDVNLLLNSTWFTPLDDAPPPASYTEKQAIAATAVVVCQGGGVNWALTPGHSGVYGEDLERAKAAGAWFRRVKPYLEGAEPYADVAIVVGAPAAGGPGLPAANSFWKVYQGSRRSAWDSAVAIGDQLLKAGLFSRLLYMCDQGGSWPDSLDKFRAVVVPELAVLDESHLDQLRRYAKNGGRLIVFGHGSMLDAKAERRKDYGLADVLGVRLKGQVVFPAETQRAQIRVDSEYNADYGAEVLAGAAGEAWASAVTPMPHWVEVTLPEPVDLARAVLVNRPGPYQITDFEIQAWQKDRWETIKTVKGASDREITVPLSPPAPAGKLRVNILRELYRGEERQCADLAALRLVDTKGRDWGSPTVSRIPLRVADLRLSGAFGDRPPAWPPMAVQVEPISAAVLAHFDLKESSPGAIFANRAGSGEALLVAVGDGAFPAGDPFWTGLARLVAGEPTIRVAGEQADRVRIILTRLGGAHVLHVIDSRAGGPEDAPAQVTLTLLSERLGNPSRAKEVGGGEPPKSSQEGSRLSLTLRVSPVASVVLE